MAGVGAAGRDVIRASLRRGLPERIAPAIAGASLGLLLYTTTRGFDIPPVRWIAAGVITVSLVVLSLRLHVLLAQARDYSTAVAAVDRVMHRIAAGRPNEARTAICDAAKQLVGAVSVVLFEPDPTGSMLVPTATAGSGPVPDIRLTLDGDAVDGGGESWGHPHPRTPYSAVTAFRESRPVFHEAMSLPPRIAAMAAASNSVASLSQPVIREGRTVGVLAMAWPRRLRKLPLHITQRVEMLAEEAAVALYQAAAAQRLTEMATSDPLTGLPNRREFDRLLRSVPDAPYAILAIDLDDLKGLNDAFGHEAGDLALKALAEALPAALRPGDVVARIGGDEFAALLRQTTAGDAATTAERLRQTMHAVPLALGHLRVSVGLAAAPAGVPLAQTWVLADRALYDAKEGGRDRVVVAEPEPTSGSLRRSSDSWVAEIISGGAVESVFQPIVRLADRGVAGWEALIRPLGGDPKLDVALVFAAAHRLGLEQDLDWLCRRSAMAAACAIPKPSKLFLNISTVSLFDPLHDPDGMIQMARWAGFRPTDLVLEINEHDAIRDPERLEEVVAAYREQGFAFAVDNVGQGHSTLEVLAAVVPEYVKLSARFAAPEPPWEPGGTPAAPPRRAGRHSGPHSVVRAVVTFAHASGAQVIAEGLETEAAVELMAELGVELGQGYLLGEPRRAGMGLALETASARAGDPEDDKAFDFAL